MDQEPGELAEPRHRIPAIERMMDVLGVIEAHPEGVTIRAIAAATGLPRTAVYRILNTLEWREVVRRGGDGAYALGPRLLALAARVVGDGRGYDLAALARPHLERLALRCGEGTKLSVLDAGTALVLAVVQGSGAFALTAMAGQRLPLHAGAASKLLLAHAAEPVRAAILAGPLPRFTPRTVTDPARLHRELAQIARRGWAEDKGEFLPSVHAVAAPVVDRAGRTVAALSVPYLAGSAPEHAAAIKVGVVTTAGALSADLPAAPGSSGAAKPCPG